MKNLILTLVTLTSLALAQTAPSTTPEAHPTPSLTVQTEVESAKGAPQSQVTTQPEPKSAPAPKEPPVQKKKAPLEIKFRDF